MGVYHCFRCGAKGRCDKSGTEAPKKSASDLDLFSMRVGDTGKYWEYLRSRGVPDFIILKYFKWSPQLPNRVINTISKNGRTIVLNARTIVDDDPKYITYGPKSKHLYRGDEYEDFVVLTEGTFDALATPHGVCTFGKGISEEQVRLLLRFRKVYIAYDSDAFKEAQDTADRLNSTRLTTAVVIRLPKGKDPASLGYKVMGGLLKQYG